MTHDATGYHRFPSSILFILLFSALRLFQTSVACEYSSTRPELCSLVRLRPLLLLFSLLSTHKTDFTGKHAYIHVDIGGGFFPISNLGRVGGLHGGVFVLKL